MSWTKRELEPWLNSQHGESGTPPMHTKPPIVAPPRRVSGASQEPPADAQIAVRWRLVEITFAARVPRDVQTLLRSAGFRWRLKYRAWQAPNTEATLRVAGDAARLVAALGEKEGAGS